MGKKTKTAPGTYTVVLSVNADLNDAGLDMVDDRMREMVNELANTGFKVIAPVIGEGKDGPELGGFFYSAVANKDDPDFLAWREKYGEAVDGESTVECYKCGQAVHGDDPMVSIDCWHCFKAASIQKRYGVDGL